jgi:Ca2+-transporting ATPase
MTDIQQGLSAEQASALLAEHGPNQLEAEGRHGFFRRLWDVLREPTLLVLLAVLCIYVFLGQKGDAGLLSLFVFLVIIITFMEEGRTEEALKALKNFASPRALVRRGGQAQRIAGVEVVPGDVLLLMEGDRVPADARVLESHDFKVDESLLTGESLGVWKQAGAEGELGMAYAGSLVQQGQATALVTATGMATRMGGISRGLSGIASELTPFQKSTKRLVSVMALVAVVSCGCVVALALAQGQGWGAALVQGLTLAIATVPEEMPVVLTVFLALGARRLSKVGVLAHRIPAVETLGAITLLAVDKTGTLTTNEMLLKQLAPCCGADEAALLDASARACELDPFDPMERQILSKCGAVQGELAHEWSLAGRPPRMAHLWKDGRLAAKGAVEGVLQHCSLSEAERQAVLDQAADMARQGLRVLGVAEGRLDASLAPPQDIPQGLRFAGLLGFEDPVRPGVREAIGECRRGGISVVMMTGDAPETALAVARQLGFQRSEQVVTGGQLALAEPGQVERWAREVDIFARLAPEQKHSLVQAWTRQGQVVGMTGDGVNDAPALAQAHVGVAMGARGTDVAREAAALVLTDDSFTSLVAGVRTGRATTQRILLAASFILAVHVPIVTLVLACLALRLPPLITAAQVAFLELFIGPACSVVFERNPIEADCMDRRPRDPQAALVPPKAFAYALLQGLVILAVVLGIYGRGIHGGQDPVEARSLAFFTLLLADLLLCWVALSHRPFWRRERWANLSLYLVGAGVLGLMGLLVALPWTGPLLHMKPLSLRQLLMASAAAAAATLWAELPKALSPKAWRRGDSC